MRYVPLMHFTKVDLPAPLSPTRAVTSPALAWKSTFLRTPTAPKLLFMLRISRIAAIFTSGRLAGVRCGVGRRGCGDRPPRTYYRNALLYAVLRAERDRRPTPSY